MLNNINYQPDDYSDYNFGVSGVELLEQEKNGGMNW